MRIIRNTLICILLALSLSIDVSAADDKIELCEPVGLAGDVILYRCEDWQAANVCYLNTMGFIFCLPE